MIFCQIVYGSCKRISAQTCSAVGRLRARPAFGNQATSSWQVHAGLIRPSFAGHDRCPISANYTMYQYIPSGRGDARHRSYFFALRGGVALFLIGTRVVLQKAENFTCDPLMSFMDTKHNLRLTIQVCSFKVGR